MTRLATSRLLTMQHVCRPIRCASMLLVEVIAPIWLASLPTLTTAFSAAGLLAPNDLPCSTGT